MSRRHGVKGAKDRALAEDRRLRKQANATKDAAVTTQDSYQNFMANLGLGTDNLLSGSSYGFNPITRIRTLLEWIHRGSWLGGVAVDVIADDMTRAGNDFVGALDPVDKHKMHSTATRLGLWSSFTSAEKWARLYGGALIVMLIDGQDPSTPLRIESIGKDQLKGFLVLDRWMVEPSLSNLVTELGPHLGKPKFYSVTADAPALPRMVIHYSRCVRLEGLELPYYQKLQENLWGLSVLERLYDRMVAFDSATTGAAQLVYKAHLRVLRVDQMRAVLSQGGKAEANLMKYTDMMRRFQGIEGITLIDAKDEFSTYEHGAFSGISDILTQLAQQISGCIGAPMVRLLGQSPGGLGSTGEGEMRIYYDNIHHQQEREFHVPQLDCYKVMARSLGFTPPEDFDIEYNDLYQLNETEKGDLAEKVERAVEAAEAAGIISQQTAMKELRQSSRVTGVFTNITDEDIEAANDEAAPSAAEAAEEAAAQFETEAKLKAKGPAGGGSGGAKKPAAGGKKAPAAKRKAGAAKGKGKNSRTSAQDSISAVAGMKQHHGLDVVIENPAGSLRRGVYNGEAWEVAMPADYGYVRMTEGADGDQLDCYVGPHPASDKVFIVDQLDIDTGAFDEHKVLFGYDSWGEAYSSYVAGFSDGRGAQRIGSLAAVSMDEFKAWMASTGGNVSQPFTKQSVAPA